MNLSPEELDDFTVRPLTERIAKRIKRIFSKKPMIEEEAIKKYFNLPAKAIIKENSDGQRVIYWPNGGSSVLPPTQITGTAIPEIGRIIYGTAFDPRISINPYNPGYYNSRL